MKKKTYELELHYSVQNGGDGSAYPHFMESRELADWDQENQDEGWGESCTGSIKVYSASPITTDEDVKTKEGYLLDLIDNDMNSVIGKFVEEFFPDGVPTFTVEVETIPREKDYVYNIVKVDGEQVGKIFRRSLTSGKVLEDALNNINAEDGFPEDD